jgi:hypothetical protein
MFIAVLEDGKMIGGWREMDRLGLSRQLARSAQ